MIDLAGGLKDVVLITIVVSTTTVSGTSAVDTNFTVTADSAVGNHSTAEAAFEVVSRSTVEADLKAAVSAAVGVSTVAVVNRTAEDHMAVGLTAADTLAVTDRRTMN